MKQINIAFYAHSFLTFLLLLVFIAVNSVSLFFIQTAHASNQGLFCLDVFQQSPSISLDTRVWENVTAGAPVTVSGSYDNLMETPVYDVSIYAALYSVDSGIPLDWKSLVAADVVNAKTDLVFNKDWTIPSDFESGEYEIRLFVDVGYNLIYSRLLSKDSSDYVATFSVGQGATDATLLQQDSLKINGAGVTNPNTVIVIPADTTSVDLEVSLNNTVAEVVEGEISIEVYTGHEPREGARVYSAQNTTSLLNSFPSIERINFAADQNDYTVIISHTTIDGQTENLLASLTKEGSEDRDQNINPVVRFVTIDQTGDAPAVRACVTNTNNAVTEATGEYEYELTYTAALFTDEVYDPETSEPTYMSADRSYIGNTSPVANIGIDLPELVEGNKVFFEVETDGKSILLTQIDYGCVDCTTDTTPATDTKTGTKMPQMALFVVLLTLIIFSLIFFYNVAMNLMVRTKGQSGSEFSAGGDTDAR